MSPDALGPSPPGVTATLLVISPGEEVAKRIESHLRNAGHPVRALWVTDLEDMENAIRRSRPDLVLCQDAMAKASVKDALALVKRLAPDLPMLLLASKPFTMADTVAALRMGVRGLVLAGDSLQLQHLETICLRELGTHRTLVELRRVRARLADFEARHERLLAGTADAILRVQEGIVTHVNAAFAAMLGYQGAAELEGNPLMDLVAPEGAAAVKASMKSYAQGKQPSDTPLALVLAKKDGTPLKVTAHVTLSQDSDDKLLEFLVRSEAQPKPVLAEAPPPPPAARTEEAVTKPAPALPLAGRLELFEVLNQSVAANTGMHRALVMVMVDSFGTVEEKLGYHESELALAQLVELVRQRLGPKEPLFRFSTALVAVVVSRPNVGEFTALAETLRQDIVAHLFKTDSYEAHLAATVVAYPLSPNDKAIDVVDTTVREARRLSREGGNRTGVLGATAQQFKTEEADQRQAERIKRALVENRLKLAFQSIASLEGDARQHFDVLARMLDETGTEVPAREFIPAAEKFGLIVAIDRWIMASALRTLAKREGATGGSSLFVRLSEQTLRDGDAFLRWLTDQLKPRPLKKEELVVSLQEPMLEKHIGKATALAKALQGLGVGINIDYFGVGDKSVMLLEHIKADFVRFHYSFTKDFNDQALQSKLTDLMHVAKAKRIKTIVGQVEDANAMARLWQLGVNYIQGYHIQAPEAVLLSTDVKL